MNEPVDYGELGAYLKSRAACRRDPSPDALPLHLARQHQGQVPARLAPRYDLKRLTDAAFDYQRAADDPRVVWYPGLTTPHAGRTPTWTWLW